MTKLFSIGIGLILCFTVLSFSACSNGGTRPSATTNGSGTTTNGSGTSANGSNTVAPATTSNGSGTAAPASSGSSAR